MFIRFFIVANTKIEAINIVKPFTDNLRKKQTDFSSIEPYWKIKSMYVVNICIQSTVSDVDFNSFINSIGTGWSYYDNEWVISKSNVDCKIHDSRVYMVTIYSM